MSPLQGADHWPLYLHMVERKREFSVVCFRYKGINPAYEGSILITWLPPKGATSHRHHTGVRISSYEFGGTLILSPLQCLIVTHLFTSPSAPYSSMLFWLYLPPYPAKCQGLIFQPCMNYNYIQNFPPSSLAFCLPTISVVPKLQFALVSRLS